MVDGSAGTGAQIRISALGGREGGRGREADCEGESVVLAADGRRGRPAP